MANAPNNAMNPPPIQAMIRVKSLGTGAAAYPANKKIPEPIMLPVTMDVASNSPKTRFDDDILVVLGFIKIKCQNQPTGNKTKSAYRCNGTEPPHIGQYE